MNDKKLSICMVIDAWEPIVGGGQNHVLNICRQLTEYYNCKVDLFVRDLPGSAQPKIISINQYFRIIKVGPRLNFFNPFGRLLWLFLPIVAIMRQHKIHSYDLVHAHAYFGAIPGKIVALIIKKPIIFTVHGSNLLDTSPTSMAGMLEKYLLTGIKYDCEISVSSNFTNYRNINSNIVVIPNGVDVDFINNMNVDKYTKEFRIIYVGRLDKIKGVHILLESVMILADQSSEVLSRNNVKFIIVGYGYDEKSLKKYVAHNTLTQWVDFRGKLAFPEVVKEYKKASLFVLPSLAEGQPLTLLEAWAAKLPVIVTDVGDNNKFIKQGVNGYIIPAGDPVIMAKTLLKVINDHKRSKIGNVGFNLVKDTFSWQTITHKTFQVYQEVLRND